MSFKPLASLIAACLLIFCSCPASASAKQKIALLFLTRQAPNHPELWKKLLADSRSQYSVYFHSKEPIPDPFFERYRIAKIVPTNWSIHVKAWQALIQEAIKDPENAYFVFLSEACIPLYSLDYIHKIITADSRSHMAFAGPWWPASHPRELHTIDPAYRFGNTEWMVLNRKHAESIAADRAIIRIVSRHPHDQESYFATFFALNQLLDDNLCNHSYTYVNWEHAVNNGASPYHFSGVSEFNEALINHAYSIGALFARKFTPEYPWEILWQMICEHTPKKQ